MKHIKTPLLIVIILTILTACGGETIEENIVGTWSIESAVINDLDGLADIYYERIKNDENKLSKEDIKEQLKKEFTSEIEDFKFVFKANNEIIIYDIIGQWEVKEDEKTIVIKNKENVIEFVIDKLTNKNFDFQFVLHREWADIKIDMKSIKVE